MKEKLFVTKLVDQAMNQQNNGMEERQQKSKLHSRMR